MHVVNDVEDLAVGGSVASGMGGGDGNDDVKDNIKDQQLLLRQTGQRATEVE